MFIEALFTIANTWKQPISLSTDEWIKIYIYEYYSAIKKNEMMPFVAAWIALEITGLSELIQTQRDK